ncbi:MAG: ABC transporter substrate-binding protein, partial [Oscillospiraceae bacterium]|nr:ABC transporter substrate-binding protein [Oscillospiraceae bacterium]
MKRFFALLLAVVMCFCLLAACGTDASEGTDASSDAQSADAAETADTGDAADAAEAGDAAESGDATAAIKIGGTGPLTGGAAIYGNAAKNGAEIAVEEINALGGIQFELKYEDDVHDAEKAVNAYNNLKDWGMQISLGSVTSTPAIATSALNNQDSIFALTPSASNPAVTEGKDNVFQMCFTDPGQGAASAQYIANQGLATKIAIIYKNDDAYSISIHDTFVAKAAELGLEIVSEKAFTTDSQSDFTVQL